MQCAGKTDVGLLRKENQDTFLIKKTDTYTLGIVCDGMGGMQRGDLASKLASESFADHIEKALSEADISDKETISSILKNAAQKANGTVFDYSVNNGYFYGMGTTLVSFLVTDNALYALNVGDSRCYKIEKGALVKITKDHSYVQQLVDIGLIKAEEANSHPDSNIITRSIGIESQTVPDVYVLDAEKFDALLLCSDGLTKCVEENKINDIICSGNDAEKICDDLVEAAKAGGGHDNITVVVMI